MSPDDLDAALAPDGDDERRDDAPGRRSEDVLKLLARALNDVAESESALRQHGEKRHHRYRWRARLALLAATAGATGAGYYIVEDLDRAREDRRASAVTLCAATSAVIDAGRATILASGAAQAGRFERNLIRLGYPSREQRVKGAQEAARLYGQSIALRVQRQAKVKGIVTPTGRLRCDVLADAVSRR